MEKLIIKGPWVDGLHYKELNFKNGVCEIERDKISEPVYHAIFSATRGGKVKITTADGKPYRELPKAYQRAKLDQEIHTDHMEGTKKSKKKDELV
jgi:hypothetical protein